MSNAEIILLIENDMMIHFKYWSYTGLCMCVLMRKRLKTSHLCDFLINIPCTSPLTLNESTVTY